MTEYLVDGFTNGFRIEHQNQAHDIFGKNSDRIRELVEIARKKIRSEVEAGRIAGPFDEPPFQPFQISPLNLREKKTPGKYRLLHNLAWPYDDSAVNSNIPESAKRVKYSTVHDAIKSIMKFPKGAFTAKTDISDAYRIIPLHPDEYPKLGIYFEGQYYFDKNLPQGCGSSAKIFETFVTALQAIFQHYYPQAEVTHLLDDFFFAARNRAQCQFYLDAFLKLCSDIGVPLAPEKTTSPATDTVFLGILLDTMAWLAKLPQDKVLEYVTDVQQVLGKKKVTRKVLESVAGKLSFAAAVVPARPFLRRIFNLIYTVDKPYHNIRITKEVQRDLEIWLEFLQGYNGVTYFRSLQIIPSTAINLSSDACKRGLGACYGSKWIQCAYPIEWQDLHISTLEFYPLFVLISMFGHLMTNSNVLFLCDNEAVVEIVQKQSTKDPNNMRIMRALILMIIKFNISLSAKHVPGKNNVLCDRISRFQVTPQLLAEHNMDSKATSIPSYLLPKNFTDL